jgi:hypothetical protein
MQKIVRIQATHMLSLVATFLFVALVYCASAFAQTLTTGAIAGTVTDPTGAVVPNAKVTVTSLGTGSARTVTTGPAGSYTVPQLTPGDYRVRVEATGFRTNERGPITLIVSQIADVDITLEIGKATEVVEVSSQAALIQTLNPNTTTTVTSSQISQLPNPGGDLTFLAQVAPGALMNSSGGYGNVEYNGLPSGANNFTIDGLDDNDPFLNLNNSGATNLLLGMDAIQEVTVNTTSYATDQGRLSAAQINYTTKSGTNQFHGTAHETWNGSRFNSADYFTNLTGSTKPRSNVNQFAGQVGGPIMKDKLFFFADLEGTRIVVPVVETNISYPSAAYQSYVLNTSLPAAGNSAEIPFYQNMFKLYGSGSGVPVPAIGCPFDVGGAPAAVASDGTGCLVHNSFSLSNHAKETLFTIKIDQNHGTKDTIWYRFQLDNGTQPTYTDPINAIFDAISIQPERNANAGWTHTFSPTLVNQFNPGFAWYTAIFKPLSLSATTAAFPEVLGNLGTFPFTALGGEDYVWPQGRNVMQWQLNDNLTWTFGKHSFIFGENLRRVLVSDHDFGFFNTPYTLLASLDSFSNGVGDLSIQSFPITLSEPVGVVNLDSFFMDTFKVTSKFTFTYGIRAAWNGDPVNQHGLYSRPSGSFDSFSHDVTIPPNQVLKSTSYLLPSTPAILWQPRGAIAYQFQHNTVFRAGFGVFSDIFPASLSDALAENAPYDPQFFVGGLLANIPGGVISQAVAADQAFNSAFSSGVVSCANPTAPANCVPQFGITTVPSGKYQWPYSLQWSAGIDQQFGNSWGLKVQYVGTRQVHEPYEVNPDSQQTACPGCFAPYPLAQADPRFSAVTQYVAGAGSSYNGLQVNTTKRLTHGLQFALNYTYSHCIDTISNGGIFGFGGPTAFTNAIPGELYRSRGDCDYDIPNALNGNYVYALPFHSSNGLLNRIIGGWQVTGNVFLRGGFPFSATTPSCTSFVNPSDTTNPPCYANQVPGVNPYAKFQNLPSTQPGQVQWLNPNAFVSTIDTSTGECVNPSTLAEGVSPQLCQFGSIGRNTLRAPHFRWSDMFVTKRFKLTEKLALRVDGQFYNVFNHPNFTYPTSANVGVPGTASTLTGVGTISAEVTPPTGLLGSFLGGDNAVRMIAFQARIEF